MLIDPDSGIPFYVGKGENMSSTPSYMDSANLFLAGLIIAGMSDGRI